MLRYAYRVLELEEANRKYRPIDATVASGTISCGKLREFLKEWQQNEPPPFRAHPTPAKTHAPQNYHER
jgi:hypothetical protein